MIYFSFVRDLLGWASAGKSVLVDMGTSVRDVLYCRLLTFLTGASPISMFASSGLVVK